MTHNPILQPTPAASDKGTPVVTERIQSTDAPRPEVMSADTLIGYKVVSPSEEHIGDIDDIMLDIPRGRIGYAVLSVGGFLGIGERLYAVPWKALMLDVNNKRFVMDIDKETLKNAESFEKGNPPPITDPQWDIRIHEYYRVRPYWE